MKFLMLFIVGFMYLSEPIPSETGKIRIELEGLASSSGMIGIMVFNQADGFPTDKEKAFISREYKLDGSFKNIEIEDLPHGKYAISIVHDVNGNKDLDKNIFGIPTEPFGFSGNKSILFGLPKFDEAVIELNTQEVESKIKLIDLF